MTLAIMSHHHQIHVEPRLSSMNCSVVKRSAHPDLQRISSQTLCSLLENQSDDLMIIDARYPFEYAGGHINSARNIHTETDLRVLFNELIQSSTRPSILVFHCEFSSERGPRLCRLFRSFDRQYNLTLYPQLTFPSIYLLDGGYAEFYQHSSAKQFCQPQAYISMFEQQYNQELQVYRRAKKISNGRMNLIEQQGPIQFCLS